MKQQDSSIYRSSIQIFLLATVLVEDYKQILEGRTGWPDLATSRIGPKVTSTTTSKQIPPSFPSFIFLLPLTE